jgi:hypothetical protein
VPDECKNRAGTERTELSGCPEASEREAGRNPEACTLPPPPAPPGCVSIQIVSSPPLNLDLEYEGYVEPLNIYAGPTGLNPSQWEFEGSEKGEPTLHLRETPTTRGSITGSVRILGFEGQEHFGVK